MVNSVKPSHRLVIWQGSVLSEGSCIYYCGLTVIMLKRKQVSSPLISSSFNLLQGAKVFTKLDLHTVLTLEVGVARIPSAKETADVLMSKVCGDLGFPMNVLSDRSYSLRHNSRGHFIILWVPLLV